MNAGLRLGVTLAVLGLLGGAWFLYQRTRSMVTPAVTDVPLPAMEKAASRNAQPEVGFIGAAKCASCHPEAHQTWQETAHSQALAEIDFQQEPADGEFDDPNSGRHYRIYRSDGTLRQEESLIEPSTGTASMGRTILADHPARLVMGSGRFSRSYLIERDGFFFEAPATWYAKASAWNLSPGYDRFNPGFSRPVELRCVLCHVGRVEPVDNSPHRVAIHAQPIDCERCHGAGQLHAERWAHQDQPRLTGPDDTIINPAKLSRERAEDVCAQCHLHSAATVEVRGRQLKDFRPGQRLADFVVHYAEVSDQSGMAVVGHAEQMRLSRCWKESDTLTCTTCHDPHARPAAAEMETHYRKTCLECHKVDSCGVPVAERTKTSRGDSCIVCHMPSSPTEIPHFAFTHHRIGIHDRQAAPESGSGELVVLGEPLEFSEWDTTRNLGLAYLQFSDAPGQGVRADDLRLRARQLLEQTAVAGVSDPDVDAGLARLWWRFDPEKTRQHASAVLSHSSPSPEALATACYTLGATEYDADQFSRAIPLLQRVNRLRPTADTWMMLSDSLRATGDRTAAINAARKSVDLAPERVRYVQALAALLQAAGQLEEARSLDLRARRLEAVRLNQTRNNSH